MLAEFSSVIDALESAVEFQQQTADRNAGVADESRLEFRVGINLGEVIHDRDDVYGDGVNLTARIQELAVPGGVSITGAAHDLVAGRVGHKFADLGFHKLENIAQSVRVYSVQMSAATVEARQGSFRQPDERSPIRCRRLSLRAYTFSSHGQHHMLLILPLPDVPTFRRSPCQCGNRVCNEGLCAGQWRADYLPIFGNCGARLLFEMRLKSLDEALRLGVDFHQDS